MKYKIELSVSALEDILRLKKAGEIQTLKKLKTLLSELENHPETGIGHPEKLKENLTGKWSRHIAQKHRLVYEINNEIITVFVINVYGHYGQK